MIITSETHPYALAALNCIDDDSRVTGSLGLPAREIPDRWGGYMENVNNTIGKMSREKRSPEAEPLPTHVKPNEFLDSEFYAFCNGEFLERTAIGNRDLHHTEAMLFLDDYFEDWSLTATNPKQEPGNVARQRRVEWLEDLQRESTMGLTAEQLAELDQLKMSLL
jgi:hypothetical protein